MIKHINHQNFLTTPFVAYKNWRLYNDDSDELVILEPTGSEDTVALEFPDYSSGTGSVVNTQCSIALEQQSEDLARYQEGQTGSGVFNPDVEEQNHDGTFKRLVHSQIKTAFYNSYRNPTQIFGMEYIDFPLSQTFRDLSEEIRVFTIPQNVFGERIVGNSVMLRDTSLDDNIEIKDDGYQNLIAGDNIFSKVQEVRTFGNIFGSGSATYCTGSCKCVSPTTASTHYIANWTDVRSQLTPNLCATSSYPAQWDGVFNMVTTQEPYFSGSLWYFISQSIFSAKAAANEVSVYPDPSWVTFTFTQIYWNNTGGWTMIIGCANGDAYWVGDNNNNDMNNACGTYQRWDGSGPDTIEVSVTCA